MSIKLIYITAPNRTEAEAIAETVVTEQLAACANIIDGVTSIYQWEEKLCKENEAVLLLKTASEQAEALIARVKELHSYECPCIVAVPIKEGNPDFLKWVGDSVQPGSN